MAEIFPESPSYFELPRRTQASGSSGACSPLSDASISPQTLRARQRRPRLGANFRSLSDNTHLRLDKRIAGVPESNLTQKAVRTHIGIETPLITEVDEIREVQSNCGSANSSTRTPDSKNERRSRWSQSARSTPEHKYRLRTRSQRSSQLLSRVLAGRYGINRSISDQDILPSLHYGRRALEDPVIPPSMLLPLRPPSTPAKPSRPASEHRIRVEKSFNTPLEIAPEVADKELSRQRNSSINPRHIFAISVDALRRIRGKSDDQTMKELRATTDRPKLIRGDAKGHLTNLKKHQTAVGLLRAASILQEWKKPDSKGRTGPGRTAAESPIKVTHHHRDHDMTRSPMLLGRVKSMEIDQDYTASQSSSLAELRRGPMPNNTPEERATYSVLNQDGHPEEFLKVDISIRGQTSYLPSEARRIHTPPLPSEDRGGRRRGFFFDYNVASNDGKLAPVGNCSQASKISSDDRNQCATNAQVSRSPTSSRKDDQKPIHNVAKVRVGDWYATQLAVFDSSSESGRSAILSFEKEQQRLLNEARLDHSIPEHLPTSPLCPRHPRYWRVVKNKGSQFRGCWMHGFGEFSEKEKMNYGIIVREKV